VSNGIVGVMFDGVASVMSNGVMGVYIHHGVCDFFVGVAFRSPFFNIFNRVPYSNFNVSMSSGD
jgi:hypothetical protein